MNGPVDLIWWITAVEIPAVAGLFWLNWRMRSELSARLESQREGHDAEMIAASRWLGGFQA